ncbi:MAG: PrgI family protein [Candidatus Spechtbacterales bacterium]|nr:PrgI family protein [Candidatus Spechtbacterales bacterium]
MSQYPVPQFIERETKLVGPLTGRQLIIFGVVAFILFVLYFIVPPLVLLLIGAVLLTGAGSLAFIRVNNRSLDEVMFSFINYFFKPRVYFWQKKEPTEKELQAKTEQILKSAYKTNNKEGEPESKEEDSLKINEEEKIKNLANILNE